MTIEVSLDRATHEKSPASLKWKMTDCKDSYLMIIAPCTELARALCHQTDGKH